VGLFTYYGGKILRANCQPWSLSTSVGTGSGMCVVCIVTSHGLQWPWTWPNLAIGCGVCDDWNGSAAFWLCADLSSPLSGMCSRFCFLAMNHHTTCMEVGQLVRILGIAPHVPRMFRPHTGKPHSVCASAAGRRATAPLPISQIAPSSSGACYRSECASVHSGSGHAVLVFCCPPVVIRRLCATVNELKCHTVGFSRYQHQSRLQSPTLTARRKLADPIDVPSRPLSRLIVGQDDWRLPSDRPDDELGKPLRRPTPCIYRCDTACRVSNAQAACEHDKESLGRYARCTTAAPRQAGRYSAP
jgi:hypothetical protein